ncbi:hypothetical protein [Streptomyces mirabilis]|uniref:hypothetical protein n=1 Tax=Streptomyces mirabilis TaxID=68239 RepID=UPI0036BD7858
MKAPATRHRRGVEWQGPCSVTSERLEGRLYGADLTVGDQFLQVFRFQELEEPKPGYVADWLDLQSWQQETDADIFEAIEKACR